MPRKIHQPTDSQAKREITISRGQLMFTDKQVGMVLGVSKTTVWSMFHRGEIKEVRKFGGRCTRFPLSSFKHLIPTEDLDSIRLPEGDATPQQ